MSRLARIALYYGLAFGWVSIVALALLLSGLGDFTLAGATIVGQMAVAVLYMPAPLVAALIVERVVGEGYLIRRVFRDSRHVAPRLLAVSAGAVAAIYVTMLGLTFLLGNVAGLPGVGALVFTQQGFIDSVSAALGPLAGPSLAKSPPPPVALLYVLGVWGALTAGFTLNGLFAFGEEYGWRGWLMDQLEPLGAVRANLLTGVMWGVWHAPLILMGFNYGRAGALGVVAMVVMCTPFSFLLWRARRASGSVLSAAVIHGGFNGMAGFLLLFDAGRAPLVGVPTGAVGALALGLVAAAMWPLSARWAARPIGDLVDAAPAAQVAAAAPTSAAEQAS